MIYKGYKQNKYINNGKVFNRSQLCGCYLSYYTIEINYAMWLLFKSLYFLCFEKVLVLIVISKIPLNMISACYLFIF